MLLQSLPKALKVRSRTPSEIDRNPSLDPKYLRVLPRAPGSLDGPQAAKINAIGMPSDTFGAPEIKNALPQPPLMMKKRDMAKF